MHGFYVNLKTMQLNTSLKLKDDSEEPIIAAPMLAKTSLFRDVLFDEKYIGSFWREETDFQVSAREKGYSLCCCPHAICFNYIIKNDTGGVHSINGLKRTESIIKNEWFFVSKHSKYISNNFKIGNKYIYIVKLSLNMLIKTAILPALIKTIKMILPKQKTNSD